MNAFPEYIMSSYAQTECWLVSVHVNNTVRLAFHRCHFPLYLQTVLLLRPLVFPVTLEYMSPAFNMSWWGLMRLDTEDRLSKNSSLVWQLCWSVHFNDNRVKLKHLHCCSYFFALVYHVYILQLGLYSIYLLQTRSVQSSKFSKVI